jgi:hypothetical protein
MDRSDKISEVFLQIRLYWVSCTAVSRAPYGTTIVEWRILHLKTSEALKISYSYTRWRVEPNLSYQAY